MKHYSLIIIIFLCFSSCNKENPDTKDSNNSCHNPSLLSQIKSGEGSIHELIYNSNCLVYESIERFSYKKYSYDNQKRLSKLERALLFDPTSCYMPSNISETYIDPRKAKIMEYSEFEYDSTGRLTRKLNYFINNGNNELVSYQTYEYNYNHVVKLNLFSPMGQLNQYNDYQYDENWNITIDNYYQVENIVDTTLRKHSVFEFDDKNNPLLIFASEGIPGIFTNKNNILKVTYINYNSGGEYQNTIQNTYEYNSLGYPVKANNLIYSYGE
jgi:hypothetical protein